MQQGVPVLREDLHRHLNSLVNMPTYLRIKVTFPQLIFAKSIGPFRKTIAVYVNEPLIVK